MHPMSERLILILLALVLAIGGGRAGAVATEPASLRYSMHFGGIHVVDLRLEHDLDTTAYDAGLEIRTTGLADMVVRYQGEATVDGLVREQGLRPERYGFRYKSRKSRRVVEVDYDPEAGDAISVRSKKRGKNDTTEVPRDRWTGVVDPLSAFLMLREHVRAERASAAPAPFKAEIFDGRRRYVFTAALNGRVAASRGLPDALAVEATVEPIAGFDIDDMSERERREGYRMRALFSADERALPLEVRTLNTRLTAVIRLIGCSGQACATAETDQGRRAG